MEADLLPKVTNYLYIYNIVFRSSLFVHSSFHQVQNNKFMNTFVLGIVCISFLHGANYPSCRVWSDRRCLSQQTQDIDPMLF